MTPLCASLGIDLPIIGAGMAGFSGPDLVAAVSNSGGLGILGGHGLSVAELRDWVGAVRARTDRPFGVNLLIGDDMRDPPCADLLPPADVDAVHAVLNPLRRELGMPPASGLPPAPAYDIESKFELLLDLRIPVLSVGLGNPGAELVDRCHRRGTRVVAMVTTVADGLAVADGGVDALVAQGAEAGGHRSHFVKPDDPSAGLVGLAALVPALADAVPVPVIAAGGIACERGIAAALMLGAQAAMLGTRLLATEESLAVPSYKRALTVASADATVVTDVASGRYARVIRNRFVEAFPQAARPLPYGWQGRLVAPLFDQARTVDNPDYMALWAGQSVEGIHDIPKAGDLVARLASGLSRLAHLSP